MDIEFLVEDDCIKITLQQLLPKMLPVKYKWVIHSFQGKDDLLSKLPTRLRGYRKIGGCGRIVVIIDQDSNNCIELKNKLDRIARNLGLIPKSQTRDEETFKVMNRIIVEELEAWFFGDNRALSTAFPGVPESLHKKEKYRYPDKMHNTWEQLEAVLKRAGYYQTGLDKREAAGLISQHMVPSINCSKSFQVFREGLNSLVHNIEITAANEV